MVMWLILATTIIVTTQTCKDAPSDPVAKGVFSMTRMGNFFRFFIFQKNAIIDLRIKNKLKPMLTFKKNREEEKIPNPLREEEGNPEEDQEWMEQDYEEGQLSIDVYETEKKIVIKSTIAGVKPEDLDISINNDMLTIRGERKEEEDIEEDDYLYRECYWGNFSRTIILPSEVDTQKVDAELENGILTVTLKKIKEQEKVSVKVKG